MMAKVKIEVTGAYIDGNAPGTQIDVEEKSAIHLEKIGYAKIVKETPKKAPAKKKPAAKAKEDDKSKK